jgi:hypothetical protein
MGEPNRPDLETGRPEPAVSRGPRRADARAYPGTPRPRAGIEALSAVGGERCRCGSRLVAGTPVLRIRPVPSDLAPLLAEQTFCGVACVRAFVLEALELLETGPASRVLTDADTVAAELRVLFAQVESQRLSAVFGQKVVGAGA